MWRSDPHTAVASTRTMASSAASSSGSGRSSTRTSPGRWKVTASTAETLLVGASLAGRRKAQLGVAALHDGADGVQLQRQERRVDALGQRPPEDRRVVRVGVLPV